MSVYTKYSDSDLLQFLKSGDERVFSEIYTRYHSLLYIYAYKKLRDKQKAQDIVQDVFITLWEKRLELRIYVSLANYLYTAVRNKSLDFFARRKVEERYLSSLQQYLHSPHTAADLVVRERDIEALIEKEIQALPPKMREVFELSRKSYSSHEEIAQTLGISKFTVDTQIKRALKVLRLRLFGNQVK
ncbi:RNA polymerase sigma-70 factor [Parapedobacter lycopersici]|uniref:RNA polymerase sigma-70 factor n=1 Tax=Parapedobacter lycopersici TaxID=1864939 RepID=UPI0033415280